MPNPPPDVCTVPATADHEQLVFRCADLDRFHQRDAWMNDECVNLGTQVLLRHLGMTNACGVPVFFSSWTMPTHHKCDNAKLWRVCQRTVQFAPQTIWVVPIHSVEQSHWTLAIIYWWKQEITYFDSFGSKNTFESDAKVSIAHVA